MFDYYCGVYHLKHLSRGDNGPRIRIWVMIVAHDRVSGKGHGALRVMVMCRCMSSSSPLINFNRTASRLLLWHPIFTWSLGIHPGSLYKDVQTASVLCCDRFTTGLMIQLSWICWSCMFMRVSTSAFPFIRLATRLLFIYLHDTAALCGLLSIAWGQPLASSDSVRINAEKVKISSIPLEMSLLQFNSVKYSSSRSGPSG